MTFKAGDRVILKESNPYKGILKCGKVYTVQHGYLSGNHIEIDGIGAFGGNSGTFVAKWFQKVNYDPDAVQEYEDILKAQEIMERQS